MSAHFQSSPGTQARHRRLSVVPPVVLVAPSKPDHRSRAYHWSDDAACKGQTARMFPSDRGNDVCADALSVCAGCPVIVECREYIVTMVTPPIAGVWGGMTRNVWLRARRDRRRQETGDE